MFKASVLVGGLLGALWCRWDFCPSSWISPSPSISLPRLWILKTLWCCSQSSHSVRGRVCRRGLDVVPPKSVHISAHFFAHSVRISVEQHIFSIFQRLRIDKKVVFSWIITRDQIRFWDFLSFLYFWMIVVVGQRRGICSSNHEFLFLIFPLAVISQPEVPSGAI